MSSQHRDIKINGMTCTNCALGVQRGLEDLGLQEVSVNFVSGKARFLPSSELEEDVIIRKVESLGYEVVSEDSKKGRSFRLRDRFMISAFFSLLLMGHMLVEHDHWLWNPYVQLVLAIPPFVLGLQLFLPSAWHSLKNGLPNMDVLISLGAIAAFLYSLVGIALYGSGPEAHDYMFFETAAMILTLVMLGNLIEHNSVKRTNRSMEELLTLQVPKARVLFGDQVLETPIEHIEVGDIAIVPEGERIPLDGQIVGGQGWVDEQFISGESTPLFRQNGDEVIGGSLLTQGSVRIRVKSTAQDGTLAHIVRIMEEAQMSKPSIQRLGDKVSAVFVPVVVSLALITFGLNYWAFDIDLQSSLMRSIAVLVISCPCAMGLATPTAVAVVLGKAAKMGILIKGGESMEKLSALKAFVFDKTGTLTAGDQKIELNMSDPSTELENIRSIVQALEQHSSHPLANVMLQWSKGSPTYDLNDIVEEAGMGIRGKKGDDAYFLGKDKKGSFDIILERNDVPLAGFSLEEQLKPESQETISKLRSEGYSIYLLSGDRKERVAKVAEILDISDFKANCRPEEKWAFLKDQKTPTAMVGDGINDAPSLAASYLGISMSGASAASLESAEVVILDPTRISAVHTALRLGKLGMRTIRQNLFWAFFYNVMAIPIAAMGYLDPMIAALSMAFSDIFVIGNALRVRSKKL
jgi:Cu+-exporting ATPase